MNNTKEKMRTVAFLPEARRGTRNRAEHAGTRRRWKLPEGL